MSLIDSSYFIGDLNIPNTDREDIQERLTWFIEKYEPELLRDLLGYSLYKAFMASLQEIPVEQKWIDLLSGVEYVNEYGRLTKWMGLINQPVDLNNVLASNLISIVVGRGTLIDSQSNDLLDPIPGTNSVRIPSSLIGKPFIFSQRGFGPFRPDEFSITGDTLTLSSGVFGIHDTYFYKAATLSLNTIAGSTKKSLIANYVYYKWMEDQVTQTVGLGEVATKAENAVSVSPANKMIRANNEMMDWIKEMVCFLDTKRTEYPEWQDQDRRILFRKFWYNNQFGI